MSQTKGTVKVCPLCNHPMSLASMQMGPYVRYYWICYECPYTVDYQSEEASKLEEIEIE